MASYVHLSPADIRQIASQYSLSVDRYEAIQGGAANTSYMLSAPPMEYVLTVFDDKSWTDVVNLGRLLRHLEENHFPATPVVQSADRSIAVRYEGKPVIVKRYVTGQVCMDLDERMLHQVGSTMARLHEIPIPDYLPKDHVYGVSLMSQVVGRNIDPGFEGWVGDRIPALQHRIPSDLPRGLVHGDLFWDNVLFQDTTLVAVLDFEEASEHFNVLDIGMAIVGTCVQENAIVCDRARALIRGYQEVRPLLRKEKQLLQTMVEYSAAAVSCWRFWKYHIDTVQDERQQLHADMQHLADAVRAIPASQFMEWVF